MLKKLMLLILFTCFLCSTAMGKSLSLCEFPWGPGVGADRVAVFFDERVYDIAYFGVKSGANIFPSQLPHGGIQFAISLGLFLTETDAISKAQLVEKVNFENLSNGESYESKEALIYKYPRSSGFPVLYSWYASYNFYLGNSSRVKGDWEVVIHTTDGKKYSGSFIIDGSEVEKAAPIPVEVVTVQNLGGQFKVTFPVTNADYYNVRLLDGDDFIYRVTINQPTDGSTKVFCYIPANFAGRTGRIEARFNAGTNPWPSLYGTGPVDCSFKTGQYSGVRSSTYFLLKVLE
jgi:hypothetical protein